MNNIRLLIIGMPGTPIFELGEFLSEFHKMDFFTIEDFPEEEETYFRDKIPSHKLDTGDFTSGSASSHLERDISASEKDRELDSIYVPEADDELNEEELEDIADEECGILSSEIPDLNLVQWATHVLYLKANWDVAINWFSKRRKCYTCGNVHHLEEKPPKYDGICDRCGSNIVMKPEDDPEFLATLYQNWRSKFSVFEMKCKKENYWKSINIDDCEDFDEIIEKAEKWFKKTAIGTVAPNVPQIERTPNKNWY